MQKYQSQYMTASIPRTITKLTVRFLLRQPKWQAVIVLALLLLWDEIASLNSFFPVVRLGLFVLAMALGLRGMARMEWQVLKVQLAHELRETCSVRCI